MTEWDSDTGLSLPAPAPQNQLAQREVYPWFISPRLAEGMLEAMASKSALPHKHNPGSLRVRQHPNRIVITLKLRTIFREIGSLVGLIGHSASGSHVFEQDNGKALEAFFREVHL